MKAFLFALIAAAVIAVVADRLLTDEGEPASKAFALSSVRLS
jgi:hypothetical protein